MKHLFKKLTVITAAFTLVLSLVIPLVATPANAVNLPLTIPDTPVADFPQANGQVNAILRAPDGSIYIGGSFTQVDGQPRNRLAHILPDGTLSPDFNPDINSSVSALALSPDGSTLYAGGNFNTVNGSTTRNRLAAFNTSTGIATSFDPNINNTIAALALSLDGQTLYAGGFFNGANSVNGSVTRNRLAAFDTTQATNNVTSFDPNISGNVYSLALSNDGTTLYAGGSQLFTTVNGSTARNKLAAFNTSTGIATSFDPNIGSGERELRALVLSPDGQTLYAGGRDFTTVNGSTTRSRIAAFNTSTGIATSFDPNIATQVRTFARSDDGSTLYAGGNFTTVNGSTTRNRLAAFNTSTGIATGFNPDMSGEISAIALSSDNATLYAGGSFTTVGGQPRLNLAAFQAENTAPNEDFDEDGVPNAEEQAALNNGDANNDGTPDYQQSHVASILNPDTTTYAVLQLDEQCSITTATLTPESANTTPDPGYDYPLKLMDFTADCEDDGFTTDVTQYYYHAPEDQSYTVRKYNPNTNTYRTIDTADIQVTTIDSTPAITATYSITDNGDLDLDNAAGIIRDPVGLGVVQGQSSAASSNLAQTGTSLLLLAFLAVTGVGGGGVHLLRRAKRHPLA